MLAEFFGINGYAREPEGFMSWQHLAFVTALMVLMVVLAVVFGRRLRREDVKKKNVVLIVAALLIDGFELFKIVFSCVEDPSSWVRMLPLFLCSIQLITIPLAAFSKGRIKEASLDFVAIFGILGALLGTYAAAQNYNAYPVLSFTNVVSGITHAIAGFASLYILISGMASMKKRNIGLTFSILLVFCAAAFIANSTLDYNYMFLRQGDGTPYDILYNLVGGHPVFYPLGVVVLFLLYIVAYYAVYYLCTRNKSRQKELSAVH